MVKIRPRGSRIQYDIRFRWPDGTLYRERANAPVASRSGAQRWAEARERELLAGGKAALEAPVTPAEVATLEAFWPRVVADHYEATRKKPSTIDGAKSIYRNHLAAELGPLTLDRIDAAAIAGLKGRLTGHEPKTANNVLAVLSRALRCAVEWQVLAAMPPIGFFKIADEDMSFYDRDEYRRLVDAARSLGSGHLVLVLLGGSAGLRRGEIRALSWSDLDLERSLIRVGRGKWRQQEGTTKGGRSRLVPMTPELREALTRHKHNAGPRVLYSRLGRELSNRTIRNWLWSSERRAELVGPRRAEEGGAIHKLRHTFCSHLAMAGVPARTIQELAGHADITTTQRYMHLAPGSRSQAIEALSAYHATAPTVAAAAE